MTEFVKSECFLKALFVALYLRFRARRRDYEAQWRTDNPEKEAAKLAKYNKSEKGKSRFNRYNKTAKAKARLKKWDTNNPEKRRKIWRENRKRAYHTRIEVRLKVTHRNRVSKELGKARDGKTSQSILGCSYPELKAWIEAQWTPGMNWENYGRTGWVIDHKLPIAKFDLTNPDHVKVAFHYTNLQPMWALENNDKRAKILPEFEPFYPGVPQSFARQPVPGVSKAGSPGDSFVDSKRLSA